MRPPCPGFLRRQAAVGRVALLSAGLEQQIEHGARIAGRRTDLHPAPAKHLHRLQNAINHAGILFQAGELKRNELGIHCVHICNARNIAAQCSPCLADAGHGKDATDMFLLGQAHVLPGFLFGQSNIQLRKQTLHGARRRQAAKVHCRSGPIENQRLQATGMNSLRRNRRIQEFQAISPILVVLIQHFSHPCGKKTETP